jgi:multidrug efflux pump
MYISFYSKELSNPQITDYLSRVIQPKLATLPGMAEAEILGNQVFAMRLWLDPVKLAGYGLSASDVTDAVRKYNFLSAAGEVKGEYVVTSINANTELKSAEAFAIRSRSKATAACCWAMWRGSRWARKTTTASARSVARPRCTSASRPPRRQPAGRDQGSAQDHAGAGSPCNLKVSIAYDATLFIQASINEVIKTLAKRC